MRELDLNELMDVKGKIVPALTTVLAAGAIALITIAVYKLYKSSKGKLKLSNNYGIEWE